jgi:hypothetical protein
MDRRFQAAELALLEKTCHEMNVPFLAYGKAGQLSSGTADSRAPTRLSDNRHGAR